MNKEALLNIVEKFARISLDLLYGALNEGDMQNAKKHPIVEIGRELGKTDEQIIALLVKFLETREE